MLKSSILTNSNYYRHYLPILIAKFPKRVAYNLPHPVLPLTSKPTLIRLSPQLPQCNWPGQRSIITCTVLNPVFNSYCLCDLSAAPEMTQHSHILATLLLRASRTPWSCFLSTSLVYPSQTILLAPSHVLPAHPTPTSIFALQYPRAQYLVFLIYTQLW